VADELVQVAREIVRAKEQCGAAVKVSSITINGRPAQMPALEELLSTVLALQTCTPASAASKADESLAGSIVHLEVSAAPVLRTKPIAALSAPALEYLLGVMRRPDTREAWKVRQRW
jgi:hypothetical protein